MRAVTKTAVAGVVVGFATGAAAVAIAAAVVAAPFGCIAMGAKKLRDYDEEKRVDERLARMEAARVAEYRAYRLRILGMAAEEAQHTCRVAEAEETA